MPNAVPAPQNGRMLVLDAQPTPWGWLLCAGVFAAAGVVKGVVGLGLPTLAMALLALVLAPAQAAALLVLPSLVTNLWQMRPWRSLGGLARSLAGLQAGVVVGTLTGAGLLGAPAGSRAAIALGAALLLYGGWGLSGAQLPTVAPPTRRWLGPLAGGATGLVTAATGVFVIPAVPYLQALGLPRDALVQAMGLSFTVSTVALAAGLALNGHLPATMLSGSALMLVPALLGMQGGQWLRRRLSPARFRACFMTSLMALGGWMVARAL